MHYSKYNKRVKRFLKYLDDRPWQIDTISDQEDEKIRAEFLKIFRPKKPKKAGLCSTEGCDREMVSLSTSGKQTCLKHWD